MNASAPAYGRWIRFLRSYGPAPTNDNMYDETIRRAQARLKIAPLNLPAPLVQVVIDTFSSSTPKSVVLTGTAGDGKTYHARQVWLHFGGSEEAWDRGEKVQELTANDRTFIFVKDLSELVASLSVPLLEQMATDVVDPNAKRIYLISANHGQLLEKLKEGTPSDPRRRMSRTIEELLVTETSSDVEVGVGLHDLSNSPAAELFRGVVEQMTNHSGWSECQACPLHAAGGQCSILENRARLMGTGDKGLLLARLLSLIEMSEHNGQHFPIRQLLALAANAILGHPDGPDGLLKCDDAAEVARLGTIERGSIYRNLFGENLRTRHAETLALFRKLSAFGIGGETSNRVDNLLVYGSDDPKLTQHFQELVGSDPVYGATTNYISAQRRYLESGEEGSRDAFLPLLRAQRQRLFFSIPAARLEEYAIWDLTVFRFGGGYLEVLKRIKAKQSLPAEVLRMIVRGLNRVLTGMLVQNYDELVLATSGSHSQSKTSSLLDELISVPRMRGEDVVLGPSSRGSGVDVIVRLGPPQDPVRLKLTPTRFEFLGRVADGALPSSFSLECHEDLLAFKAKLLGATALRRHAQKDPDEPEISDVILRFIELSEEGRAIARTVAVRS